MFNKLHSVPTSRLVSTLLAAVMFAGLTAPFIMLQSMHVFAAAAPPPCTVGNYNGCTELSSTPPEDLQSVPPNIVLMLDDSGSMDWDFMPDWGFLGNGNSPGWNTPANDGPRNPGINGVYYNPATVYTPPPYADSVDSSHLYADSPGLLKAYKDGFLNLSTQDITSYTGGSVDVNTFPYYTNLAVAPTDAGPATKITTTACPGGYTNTAGVCVRPPSDPTTSTWWTCNAGDLGPTTHNGIRNMCRNGSGEGATWYHATLHTSAPSCPAGSTLGAGGKCYWPNKVPVTTTIYKCPDGSSTGSPHECMVNHSVRAFTYVLGTIGSYVEHYVAAGGNCALVTNATQRAHCVSDGDTSGTAAPNQAADGTTLLAQNGSALTAGQNVANWFSYYRTRLLMSKSGLMAAFSGVSPNYRFGFGSINGNGIASIPNAPAAYTFDDFFATGNGGGNSNNKLAVVQPFGDGTAGTQKAQFWTWLVNETAAAETPLRKALAAVGQYYQTAQPWTTMPGDPGYIPGSITQFTCRSSNTILTTDGFWNGDAPTTPAGIANAAATDGPVNAVPPGNITQYTAVNPYVGGAVNGGTEPSLADVATYYWENDLNTTLANELTPVPTDLASWQHMTTFTVGLGFPPVGITPAFATVPQIFGWADGGAPIPGFSWPAPASGSVNNIADLAHAAVNGRGDFFNVTNPAQLAAAFSKALADIGARNVPPATAAVNASVLSVGAMAFLTGYTTKDWTGQFQALTLKTDGSVDTILWKADTELDAAFHSPIGYPNRNVFTNAYKGGSYGSFQLTAATSASLDAVESAGLQVPALAGGNDTLANRIDFLLGDNTYEGSAFRTRSSILGAILHAEPVYVAGATGNYRDNWPTFGAFTPPEAVIGAQAYSAFASAEATRAGMVYVAANDGMLHAFNAPVPNCTGPIDINGNCTAYAPAGPTDGQEAWAFVPRAAYVNLGNMTNLTNFQFRPTVDATPVTRDVFFSSDKQWHTLLAGGVGLGGRGVYGLDITNPSTFSATDALWEFDADMPVDGACVTNDGTACRGTDLGYTVAQPNVGRLANGHWVVLMPNGYFPDCTTPDSPNADKASCQAIAAQAPKDASGNPYSALFVLDAQTGKVIAELKTPTIAGVTSFGLAKPVLGDYNNDQVDDVAFAGDVQGNLWRFDLSNTDPTKWAVTLVYTGLTDASGHQGVQPITTMPRLFPDPTTNRFLVLFGTGKYLGVGDNGNSNVQAIMAVRDVAGTTYSQTDLTQQFLHESVVPVGQPNAGATIRCITGSLTDNCTTPSPINAVLPAAGGWYINLYTTDSGGVLNDAGERVVVNPGAIFATNTVIFESLITGAQSTDACNPQTQGSILALNASTGGSGGVSSLGGPPIAGARITSARTSGSLPVVSSVGGGKAYLPGATLPGLPGGITGATISIDAPIWRRRSWRVLLNDQ